MSAHNAGALPTLAQDGLFHVRAIEVAPGIEVLLFGIVRAILFVFVGPGLYRAAGLRLGILIVGRFDLLVGRFNRLGLGGN